MQLAGMFGMTLSFATSGIGQVYLERVLGMGYLDAQLKIQVHFLMLVATASIFATGAGLFIYDFFRYPPRGASAHLDDPEPIAAARSPLGGGAAFHRPAGSSAAARAALVSARRQ